MAIKIMEVKLMKTNKQLFKKIIATTCITTMASGALSSYQANAISWFNRHSKEEILALYEKNAQSLDVCSEKTNKLNNPNKVKDLTETIIKLKQENTAVSSDFKKLDDIRTEIENLANEIDLSLSIQDAELRQKEAELKQKAEEQKFQAEKEERERLAELNNSKALLSEKLEAILRKAKKEIESEDEKNRISNFFNEINEKIQNMDNINRTTGVENLITSFQEDIDNVLTFEEKVRKENLEKLINDSKSELSANVEALEATASEILDETILEKFNNNISALKSTLEEVSDLNSLKSVQVKFAEIKSNVQIAIDEQNKKIAEEKAAEELESQLEAQRDENKQHELLSDGKLRLDDVIGGNKKAKEKTKVLIKAFERFNNGGKIVPSKGILYYGVPGTGKTSLAKAIAAENNMEIFTITPSLVMGEDGARKALEMFDLAKKAARVSGKLTILLIDEIDAIAQTRSSSTTNSVLVMLLNELDKLTTTDNVIVIATTNRREALDPAIIRSGRLDQSVEVGLPNAEDREKILNIYVKNLKVEKDVIFKTYADKMKGFSGADIKKTIDLAINNSMERLDTEKLSAVTISNVDLRAAIAIVMDERR